jgi:hypothetical protein
VAAPTATVRPVPAGAKLLDGFPTRIAFASKPDLRIWENGAKPPGFDGGEAIPTSTHHNVKYHTAAPRKLLKVGPVTFKAAYDTRALNDIQSLINVQDAVTLIFPDGTTVAFWGFLQKFEPDDNEEGKFPMANCTVVPTNWDPINNVEAGPAVTPAPGT